MFACHYEYLMYRGKYGFRFLKVAIFLDRPEWKVGA